MPAGMGLEPFENLGRACHSLGRTADLYGPVLNRDINPQRFADFAYVLVAGAK